MLIAPGRISISVGGKGYALPNAGFGRILSEDGMVVLVKAISSMIITATKMAVLMARERHRTGLHFIIVAGVLVQSGHGSMALRAGQVAMGSSVTDLCVEVYVCEIENGYLYVEKDRMDAPKSGPAMMFVEARRRGGGIRLRRSLIWP